MHPIDFLKIKKSLEKTNTHFEIKVNGDDSVDIVSNHIAFYLHLPTICRFFNMQCYRLPFKIRNFYGANLVIFGDNHYQQYLTDLHNFPDYCSNNLIIKEYITVASLKGIKCIKENLSVNLYNGEKYKTKNDVLKVFSDLKIGNTLNLLYCGSEGVRSIKFGE